MSKVINVNALSGGQASARDINNMHIENLVLADGGFQLNLAAVPADELRCRYAFVCEVGRALRRRFMLHPTVFVFGGCLIAFVLALVASWGASPLSLEGGLTILLGVGAVLPSAWWMVHERNALYVELDRVHEEIFALECALLRAEAEVEALEHHRY